MARKKKQKTTFQKITLVFVWIMLIFTLSSIILSAVSAFM
ncbi:DUF4044 domain-containing protein [Ligilactobacillus ceti]|nr:DUF4044 domain-containing protein [Ligilactobacillus ceti]